MIHLDYPHAPFCIPSNRDLHQVPIKKLVPCDGVEVADQRDCGSNASKNGGSSNEGEEEVLERRGHRGGLSGERMGESSTSRDNNSSLESSGLVLLGLSAAGNVGGATAH